MKDMLESMSKLFDLHVFTSSDKTYADLILKQIDPQDKYANKGIVELKDMLWKMMNETSFLAR